MMTKKQAKELLRRYRNGQSSADEQKIVESWILQELNTGRWDMNPEQKTNYGLQIKKKIDAQLKPFAYPVQQSKLWLRITLAAALIIVPAASILLFKAIPTNTIQPQIATDISPGTNAATLILADGKKIILTAKVNGKLAIETGFTISKTKKGAVVYEITAADSLPKNEALKYNTLSTAQGQQYQIRLPDGTSVWLNNSSSIKYPVNLSQTKERRVQLNGEGYFEVAKDPAHPFIVQTKTQKITVLGTHFNVNAYDDEPELKTTLLEGAVKIKTLSTEIQIRPGQQAITNTSQFKIKEVDTELAVAWKNNQFMFESESIENVMRMVKRWYNVEVEYVGEIPADKFGGTVPRFANVSEVLHILELTGKVHFKVEGRRIMVYK